MKLTIGQMAPDFSTEDVFGHPISLRDYAGKRVLLSFFRNGACAMYNLQVHRLIQKYPDYHAQGLDIIAVFESPRESILQYVGKQDAPFPIIADPTASLYLCGCGGAVCCQRDIYARSRRAPVAAAAAAGRVGRPLMC